MINKTTMFIYRHSPIWLQNVFCTAVGRRYNKQRHGGVFPFWRKFYAESRKWTEGELREYQREQLETLFRECFENVPYHAQLWKEKGLTTNDIRNVEDIAKFPITTKEDVFYASDRMISSRINRKRLIQSTTGGSTGMPLQRFFTAEELQKHYAISWDRMRPGVNLGDCYATFQGKEVVPPGQKGPPYWRENRAANQRLYSMRSLSPKNLQSYAESLVETPFVYYQGYVSIMSVVAEYMIDNKIQLRVPPKAVFATSEQLTRTARKLFEDAWQTRVWDGYGQGERCALIQECEYGNYHEQMDYGVIEYEPIKREGNLLLAEIICTGFIPHAAPLIRYRIGDRVLIEENATCPCGSPGPVIKAIHGRIGDYIVTPDGRKYPHISLIVDLLRNVRRTQVVQERPEEILVRIVPFAEYSKEDEKHLIKCFKDRIGGEIGVSVVYVNELERLPNGKTLSIINRLPNHSRRDGMVAYDD